MSNVRKTFQKRSKNVCRTPNIETFMERLWNVTYTILISYAQWVWWDFKDIVYFVLLSRNQTISLNVYCRQLMKLHKEIKKKRPELGTRKGIIFRQDNTRPHTSLVTRKKL